MATEQEGIKIYLPADEAQQLRDRAKLEDRTVTAIVRRAIRAYLAEQEAAEAAV